jgi:hypothetical protein
MGSSLRPSASDQSIDAHDFFLSSLLKFQSITTDGSTSMKTWINNLKLEDHIVALCFNSSKALCFKSSSADHTVSQIVYIYPVLRLPEGYTENSFFTDVRKFDRWRQNSWRPEKILITIIFKTPVLRCESISSRSLKG